MPAVLHALKRFAHEDVTSRSCCGATENPDYGSARQQGATQEPHIMRPTKVLSAVVTLLLCGAGPLSAQKNPYDSGGPLMPEQAAFDVLFYDLALEVHPSDRTIEGSLTMTARIVTPSPST